MNEDKIIKTLLKLLYEFEKEIEIHGGRFDLKEFYDFLKELKIKCIVQN